MTDKQVAIIRIYVDEDTEEFRRAIVWHDPDYDHKELLLRAVAESEEAGTDD